MSYTSQQFLIYDSSSDANFRAWGSAISAAIASMGWVSNGDSGQVNWTTVTAPAAGTFVYECWKPGDAGTTFVLKVEYSKGSGTPAGNRIRMSIGTTSNGAGTLTGFVTNVIEPSSGTGTGTGSTTYDCYFSGDTDRLGMILWRASNSFVCGFFVERTHNADGTNNNEGVTLVVFRPSVISPVTPVGQVTLVFGVGVGIQSNANDYISPYDGNTGSSAFNNNVPVKPAFPEYGKMGNPLTTVGFIRSADISEACFFTTTLYGATRTYLATGNFNVSIPGNSKMCMRYD